MNQLLLVGLGSNVGDRESQIQESIYRIETVGLQFLAISPIYESEPWGVDHKTSYLNAVAAFSTQLTENQVLEHLQLIEKNMGRNSKSDFKPRTIDLDLLGFGNQILNEVNFEIPHPRMEVRKFVLQPLQDVCPGWIHPELQQNADEMLKNCMDKSWIKVWNSTAQ